MIDQRLKTPLLLLIFNRPNETKQVFAEIKKSKPEKLFLAADGPRINKAGEDTLCQECKNIVLNGIDWPCEIKTLFRNENVGCGKAVSEAITWFFTFVDEGIILEDDVLPSQSFFYFTESLLKRYRYEMDVMSISGSNLMGEWNPKVQSYFFGTGGIWGWATWKRSWDLYDKSMKAWPLKSTKNIVRKNLITDDWYLYYYYMFESAFNEELDTWDAQWLYTILINNGKSINPSVNLTKNIGFNTLGTHTISENVAIRNLQTYDFKFPLKHPTDKLIDRIFFRDLFNKISQKTHSKIKLKDCIKGIIKEFIQLFNQV